MFLFFGVLFLARHLWQPWLFGVLFPRQQKLERIVNLLDAINGFAALFPLAYGAYKFFLTPQEVKSVDYPKALIPTSPKKILADVSENPEEFTWQDRHIITTSDLQTYKKILIVGRMKSGKTREAAELIRRALGEELLITSRIYDISQGMREIQPEAIQHPP